MIISVSVEVTFAVVELPSAAAAVLPPNGGTVTTPDGSISAQAPAGAVTQPVQISLLAAAAGSLALPGDSQIVGTPTIFHQEDPTTGAAAALSRPIVISIALPELEGGSDDCPGCGYVAYGQPADGGALTSLRSRLSADGRHLEVEVSIDMTITIGRGPDIAAGHIPADASGSVGVTDGSLRVDAPAAPTPLDVAIAPVHSDANVRQAIGAPIIAPQRVDYSGAGLGEGPSGRETVVEIVLSRLGGHDPNTLRAYGVDAAGGPAAGAPVLLPAVVDLEAGVLRISVRISMTIYVTAEGSARTLTLRTGWNMITFSGAADTPAKFLDTLLGSRVRAVHRWNGASQRYQSRYPQSPGAGDLRSVSPEDALWVQISSGPDLTIALPDDLPAPHGVTLYPGWNLVTWSGPDTSAEALLRPLRPRMGSAFVWNDAARRMDAILLATGQTLPSTVHTRDALWLLVKGTTPVRWSQPAVSVGAP